jgi:hypothetical protein
MSADEPDLKRHCGAEPDLDTAVMAVLELNGDELTTGVRMCLCELICVWLMVILCHRRSVRQLFSPILFRPLSGLEKLISAHGLEAVKAWRQKGKHQHTIVHELVRYNPNFFLYYFLSTTLLQHEAEYHSSNINIGELI